MKHTIIILILFVGATFAQSDLSNSVNVKKIVQQQIEEARKKEQASKQKKVEPITTTKSENKEVPITSSHKKSYVKSEPLLTTITNFLMKNTEIIKYSVLAFFSVVILSFVAVRRTKHNNEPEVKKDFKTNIQLVREEKFIKPIDPDLKKIRTNLCLTSKYLNTSEQLVTQTAKKYSLAKTEIMLAAKFRNQTAA